jgi:hypothetical protein
MTRLGSYVAATAACGLVAALSGCESPSSEGPQPSSPWSQELVTHLAGQLASQMDGLYEAAEKEPAFAGERSAYGKTLDNIRIVREESAGLHEQLEDGDSYAETLNRYKRIKEVSRDIQETENWEFLPDDFTAQAKVAFGVLSQLDAYYGIR